MKKHILIASLLASALQYNAIAQFRIDAVTVTTATGVPLPLTDNVIIGPGTGVGTGGPCTFLGSQAGSANTTGSGVFIGHSAGYSNTIGLANTFVGPAAGYYNTSGGRNAFFGDGVGQQNTSGGANTFIGSRAGAYNTTAFYNTYIGDHAGFQSTIGESNVCLGTYSGFTNLTGNFNMVLGSNSDFRASNYTNANAIGAFARVAKSNAMVLGGTDTTGYTVQVGIGTESPDANLHLESYNQNELFKIKAYDNAKQSNVSLQAGNGLSSGISALKRLNLSISGNGVTSGPYGASILPSIGGAPAIGYNDLGVVGTAGSRLIIGITPETYSPNNPDYAQDIHFITGIYPTLPKVASNRIPWECIKIKRDDGFVGIHTRRATTAAGSGDPQALFHVNLTDPGRTSLNTEVNGIRFEGLPDYNPATMAPHPDVIVVDADGNLAKSNGTGGGLDWHLTGNSGVLPFHFIGTLNPEDFRIQTNGSQKSKFTVDGNFEMGTGNTFTSTTKSTALGESNILQNTISSLASGIGNSIDNANYSSAIGWQNNIKASVAVLSSGRSNNIDNGSNYSTALGFTNIINASESALASGSHNEIILTSNNSNALGEYNIITSSTASLSSGKGNTNTTANNSFTMGEINNIEESIDAIASGNNNSITSSSDYSGAIGRSNEISLSDASFTAGNANIIQNSLITGGSDYSTTLGNTNVITGAKGSFIAGTENLIEHATGPSCMIIGGRNKLRSSYESVIAGEDNDMVNAHGSFIAGGHNYSNGKYNTLIGSRLTTSSTPPTLITPPGDHIFIIGEQINNDLQSSLSLGFYGNRTLVATQRGVNIQWNSTSSSTTAPIHNLDVEAAHPTMYSSNIAFHNLPDHDPSISLPAVLIDPTTGELFKSTTTHYIVTPPSSFGSDVIGDHRAFKDIKEISNALSLIDKIQPKKYQLDSTSFPTLNLKDKKETYGIISQELKDVLPSLVNDIKVPQKDGETIQTTNYNELIPILVQAIKEQQLQIGEQKAQIEEQKRQLNELKSDVVKIKQDNFNQNAAISKIDVELSNKDVIILDQNVPNPCDRFTSIGYNIPSTVQKAIINFTTLDGKLIKSIPINERGKGLINIYPADLSSGVYMYSLIVDGRLIDSKKMEINRQ